MKIRKGIKIADIALPASPLDIVKVMYDGDIPDGIVAMVKEYSDELTALNWYTIEGYLANDTSPIACDFSVAATALAFTLGVIAGREDSHD